MNSVYLFTPLHPNQKGFTLLEVIIATAIIPIIALAVFRLQNFVIDQQEFTLSSYITVDTANRAVEQMIREIRNSRNGSNGAYTLERAEDQTLIFYSDINHDAVVERIRYFIEGETLKKGVISPSSYPVNYSGAENITIVAENVQNGITPVFTYYNSSWPQDSTHNPLPVNNRLMQTRIIGIRLRINANSEYLNTAHEISSYAQLRTLKDNL